MRARAIGQMTGKVVPNYKISIIGNGAANLNRLSDCHTDDVETAVRFAAPKNWAHWQLYINKRKYGWPFPKPTARNRFSLLREHIAHAVDLDESFYES